MNADEHNQLLSEEVRAKQLERMQEFIEELKNEKDALEKDV